jgi:hypothetical protein
MSPQNPQYQAAVATAVRLLQPSTQATTAPATQSTPAAAGERAPTGGMLLPQDDGRPAATMP